MKKFFLLLFLAALVSPIIAMDVEEEEWELEFIMSGKLDREFLVKELMPSSEFSDSQQQQVYKLVENFEPLLNDFLANSLSPFAQWKEAGLTEEDILKRFVVEAARATHSTEHGPFKSPSFQHPHLYPELKLVRIK